MSWLSSLCLVSSVVVSHACDHHGSHNDRHRQGHLRSRGGERGGVVASAEVGVNIITKEHDDVHVHDDRTHDDHHDCVEEHSLEETRQFASLSSSFLRVGWLSTD
jgi:hypothetical protein